MGLVLLGQLPGVVAAGLRAGSLGLGVLLRIAEAATASMSSLLAADWTWRASEVDASRLQRTRRAPGTQVRAYAGFDGARIASAQGEDDGRCCIGELSERELVAG